MSWTPTSAGRASRGHLVPDLGGFELRGEGPEPVSGSWASTASCNVTPPPSPQESIRALQDHGRVDLTLESQLEEAQHLFRQLYAAGVDYEDVAATLEREGMEKLVAPFDELLTSIAGKRQLAA